MKRILFVSDVSAYAGKDSDVPRSYSRTAADPDVELWHATPQAVLQSGVNVEACRVPARLDFERLADAPVEPLRIDALHLVFDRVLKPLPDGYLDALIGWRDRVDFVNDPRGILEQLDPRFLLRAAGRFMPATIVTADAAEAEDFFARHRAIVAKRPNSCGGRAVFRLVRTHAGVEVSALASPTRVHRSFAHAFEAVGLEEGELGTFVRYLPRVVEGDLRIVTLDGRPLGAYVRRGEGWIQNVGAGGRCTPVRVTEDLATAIEATHRAYQSIGVRVLGYDFLVDDDGRRVISEINGGNVGGIFRMEALTGHATGRAFVEWMKSRDATARAYDLARDGGVQRRAEEDDRRHDFFGR